MNAASPRRRRLRRGIVILPSAFTLGNLFLGIWAIVSASRGRFEMAGWLIVLAAFADMFDGRIARFTRTGSEFGEQLDSLVDAVSFGVAPALIIYFLYLQDGAWSWALSFLYIVAAIVRLARFNVEQAGTAKVSFHGLPSPIAGVTLATYHAFTQTPFFNRYLTEVPVREAAAWMMIGVAGLMVSHVLYPVLPRFNPRTWGGRMAIALALGAVAAVFTVPELYFFPLAILYITIGLVRTVAAGFQERLPERDPLRDEEDDEGEVRELEYDEMQAPHHRVRRGAGPSSTRD
ncbi:MAG: CDP-diacylglycerol--serine O-phosphatidyltransferase [Gemmatimonadota bacterium]|nr:CDP-diacylglycerol--serine O-phosphatidyltransferase [Gemmatimonadota bacterium]